MRARVRVAGKLLTLCTSVSLSAHSVASCRRRATSSFTSDGNTASACRTAITLILLRAREVMMGSPTQPCLSINRGRPGAGY